MNRYSLRLRLLVGAALASLGALVLAGIGMAWLFQRHIELREASSLIRDGKILAAAVSIDVSGRPHVDSPPTEPRYTKAASGLYWQLTTASGNARSDSLWDQSLPAAAAADPTKWGMRHVRGPFGESLLMVERPIRTGAHSILVQVGTDDAPLRAARREFNLEMAVSLLGLWLFLLLAAYIQVALGLRPLAMVRKQIERLRGNPAARLPPVFPTEIAPLAEAINALAESREADLKRARRRAGDLAHSLKTPLAAMAAQTRRLKDATPAGALAGMERAIASISAALETELARARATAARGHEVSRTAHVERIVENLVAVIERTERGEQIAFTIDIPIGLHVPVAADDLTELLGALLENAARYARRQVRISGAVEPAAGVLRIADDGPGIGHGRSEAALVRGGRLDEAGPGHGLGLAIVSDLVSATGGTLALNESPLGGLEVYVCWPANGAAPAVADQLTRR